MRPVLLSKEEAPHKLNHSVVEVLKNVLKYILSSKLSDLTEEEFFTVLKSICHPFVSRTNKDLMILVKSLEETLSTQKDRMQLSQYFETYSKQIIEFSIRQRTGILSPDATMRNLAINMAVALAS